MRILAGLLEPTSGTATLDGESMLETARSGSGSRLGYLPQDFGFFPHLTGERMLRYLLRLKGVAGPAGLSAALRRAAGAGQPVVRGPAEGQDLLGRDAAAAGDRPGDRRRPPADHRRRADRRARPRGAPAVLPPALRARRGPDRPPLDPHRRGRGRALPPVRRDPRRAAGRRHHARRGTAVRSRGRSTRGPSRPSPTNGSLADPDRCVTQAYLVEGRNRVRVYQPEGTRRQASPRWPRPSKTPTSS